VGIAGSLSRVQFLFKFEAELHILKMVSGAAPSQTPMAHALFAAAAATFGSETVYVLPEQLFFTSSTSCNGLRGGKVFVFSFGATLDSPCAHIHSEPSTDDVPSLFHLQ
jgi:acyl CoA:acetate/3-ketoacid CoA transferase beta subunit